MSATELVIVGRLRKAHGVRGELVVEPITDAPAEVYAAGRRLFAGDTSGEPLPHRPTLTVAAARPQPDGSLLVRFAEIADRTEAERWRARYVLAPREELAPPAEGEAYLHELLGMRAVLPTGEEVGEVAAIYELPQGLTLEIRHAGGAGLLPFNTHFVHALDRAARRIVIVPPDGLFE